MLKSLQMMLQFKTFNNGAMCANTDTADSLEEAADIYARLLKRGFAVIPYDPQTGVEYWMNDEGKLLAIPNTPPA